MWELGREMGGCYYGRGGVDESINVGGWGSGL